MTNVEQFTTMLNEKSDDIGQAITDVKEGAQSFKSLAEQARSLARREHGRADPPGPGQPSRIRHFMREGRRAAAPLSTGFSRSSRPIRGVFCLVEARSRNTLREDDRARLGPLGMSLTGGGRSCLDQRQLSLQAWCAWGWWVAPWREARRPPPPMISLRRDPLPGAPRRRRGSSLSTSRPPCMRSKPTVSWSARSAEQVSYYKGVAWSDRLPRLVQARIIETLPELRRGESREHHRSANTPWPRRFAPSRST